MRLINQSDRIPRTTTRAEWHKLDRARRMLQNVLREHEEQIRQMAIAAYSDMLVYGRAVSLAEQLINPPVILWPSTSSEEC